MDASQPGTSSDRAAGSTTPPLPPVNYHSPLVVGYGTQPTILKSAREQELASDTTSFGVGQLRSALSVETAAHGEMMRKVSTAPIALNYLAVGASSPTTQSRSGGPMRRVSTSIGPLSQRRPTLFMWSMEVHRDFEHAVQTLLSRVSSGSRRHSCVTMILLDFVLHGVRARACQLRMPRDPHPAHSGILFAPGDSLVHLDRAGTGHERYRTRRGARSDEARGPGGAQRDQHRAPLAGQ